MGEGRKILMAVGGTLLLGVLAILLSRYDIRLLLSPLKAEYRVTFELEEKITLRENFLFKVSEDRAFSMLYRNWRVPLFYGEEPTRPGLEVINFGGDGIPYLKDHRGAVVADGNNDKVSDKAEPNEVGILREEGFQEGEYRLFAEYYLHPPYRYDNSNGHLNIKLADRHIFYEDVEIVIRDSAQVVEEVFPHLPAHETRKVGNAWIIRGKAPENSLVEVEILTKPYEFVGFKEYVANVKGRTLSANANLMLYHRLRNLGSDVLKALLILYPLFLFLIYWLYGSERSFTVPKYLNHIPHPSRKPWLVNMIFSERADMTDENAFMATVLDMERRGLLEVDTSEGKLRVRIKDKNTRDSYERKVLELLEKYSVYGGGYFIPEEVERLADAYVQQNNPNALEKLRRDFEEVVNYKDPLLTEGFLSVKGHRIILWTGAVLSAVIVLFTVIIFLFGKTQGGYFYDIAVLSLGAVGILNVPAFLLPPQVFGRWKRDFYRERLQWRAFRNFLSDLAMIKKYSPEDLAIWEEWLVYGTALGVAEKVESAMKELKVKIPFLERSTYVRTRFYHCYYHIHSTRAVPASADVRGGGGFGGGFGAGGGFGGGGAGGR